MPAAAATRPKQRRLAAPPLDEDARDEHHRIDGEHRELGAESQDPGARDEQRARRLGDERRQGGAHGQATLRRPLGQPATESRHVAPQRVDRVDGEAIDRGDRPPVHRNRAHGSRAQVRRSHDERLCRLVGIGAASLHPRPERVAVVGPPGPGQLDRDHARRFARVCDLEPVAGCQAQPVGRVGRQGRLEQICRRFRPSPVDQRGVLIERLVARQPADVAGAGRTLDRLEPARLHLPDDGAADGAQGRGERLRDDRVARCERIGLRACRDHDVVVVRG
jgi:hypothetical protein